MVNSTKKDWFCALKEYKQRIPRLEKWKIPSWLVTEISENLESYPTTFHFQKYRFYWPKENRWGVIILVTDFILHRSYKLIYNNILNALDEDPSQLKLFIQLEKISLWNQSKAREIPAFCFYLSQNLLDRDCVKVALGVGSVDIPGRGSLADDNVLTVLLV